MITTIHSIPQDVLKHISSFLKPEPFMLTCKFWLAIIIKSYGNHYAEYRKELLPFFEQRNSVIIDSTESSPYELFIWSSVNKTAKKITRIHNEFFGLEDNVQLRVTHLKTLIQNMEWGELIIIAEQFFSDLKHNQNITYFSISACDKPELQDLQSKIPPIQLQIALNKDFFEKITSLTVVSLSIRIMTQLFRLFPNVFDLYLNANADLLTTVECPKLGVLCLTHFTQLYAPNKNNIELVLKKFINPQIEILLIRNCVLKTIPQILFDNFQEITEISLQTIQFEVFPDEIFNLKNLSWIYMHRLTPRPDPKLIKSLRSREISIKSKFTRSSFPCRRSLLDQCYVLQIMRGTRPPQKKQKLS